MSGDVGIATRNMLIAALREDGMRPVDIARHIEAPQHIVDNALYKSTGKIYAARRKNIPEAPDEDMRDRECSSCGKSIRVFKWIYRCDACRKSE